MAAGRGLEAGAVFARLGAVFQDQGFKDFDRAHGQAAVRAEKPVVAQLSADVDLDPFALYQRKLDEARARAQKRVEFKAQLGADFDERTFRAAIRESERLERQQHRLAGANRDADASTRSLTGSVRGAGPHVDGLARGLRGLVDQAAKITIVGIGAQAVSALGAAGAAAATSLAPLAGALAAYPALGSAAAQGLGTFRLATEGVTEAIQAGIDAQSGGKDELKKYAEELKKLTPEARRFTEVTVGNADKLDQLKRSASGLFGGAAVGLGAALRNFPVLNRIVDGTAQALGRLAEQAGKLIGSRAFGQDLATQGQRNVVWLERGGTVALKLADALRNVTITAGPLVDWMTRLAVRGADVIDKFTAAGRRSGDLARFFGETRHVLTEVGTILGNVGEGLVRIGAIAYRTLGRDLLASLTQASDKFAVWTESARGRNVIRDYFERAREPVYALARLIRDATTAFFRLGNGDQVAPLIETIRTRLLPAFERLVDQTTAAFGPVFLDAVTSFLELFTRIAGTSGPLNGTVRLLGKIADGLTWMIDNIPGVGQAVVALLAVGSIYKALNIAGTVTGIKQVIGLLRRDVPAAAAVAAGAQGAAGAAAGGAAARGAAGGAASGALGGILARLGLRGGAGALATLGSRAVPVVGGALLVDQIFGAPVERALGRLAEGTTRARRSIDELTAALSGAAVQRGAGRLAGLADAFREAADKGDSRKMRQVAGRVDEIGKSIGGLSGKNIRRVASDMEDLADSRAPAEVRRELRDTRKAFASMEESGSNSVKGIRSAVATNFERIKRRLGDDSRAGKDALADNFREAQGAIRRSMQAGVISTRDGLRAIRGYMVSELATYGMDLNQARRLATNRTTPGREDVNQFGQNDRSGGNQRGGRIRRAIGGWLGGKGLVGDDTIPVGDGYLAAPGEYLAHGPAGRGAVINRHQAPVVDLALMRGGYTLDTLPRDQRALPMIEAAMRDWGGLDALFSAIDRPHMLQGGGRIVPVPGFPGERAASSVIPMIEWIARTFRVLLTDAYGQGHESPGHTRFGTAADFDGPDANMDRAVRALVARGYLVGYDGRFGSQAWPGHGPSTRTSNHHFHVELGSRGGAPPVANIPRQRIVGGGVVGQIAQRAVDLARAAGQRLLNSAAFAPVAGGGSYDGPLDRVFPRHAAGEGGVRLSPGQVRMLAGRAGLPAEMFERIAHGESDYYPGVVSSDGGYGLWQMTPRVWGAQALAQLRRFGGIGQMLNPWRNAQMAKWLYEHAASKTPNTRGFPWFGTRYLQAGGRLLTRGLQRGGRLAAQALPAGWIQSAPAGPIASTRDRTTQLRLDNIENIADVTTLQAQIEQREHRYTQLESLYNRTHEEYLRADGTVDWDAVRHRANELGSLIAVRRQIEAMYVRLQTVVQQLVASYGALIRRFSRSLRHAKNKDRSGIIKELDRFKRRRDYWSTTRDDLGFTVAEQGFDVSDLVGEANEIWATQAQTPDIGITDAGTDGTALGALDVPTGGDTAAPTTAAPTQEDIVAAANAQLQTFQASLQSLFGTFGSNFRATPAGAASAFDTPAFYGATPTGAGGTLAAAGGGQRIERVEVNQYFQDPGVDPHHAARRMQFELEAIG